MKLLEDLLNLKNEINCRREHGAEGAAHLAYIEKKLSEIIENERKWVS